MITVFFFVGSKFPVDRAKIRARIQSFLQENHIDNAILNVSIVGARKMKVLNEQYLHHEGTTDVLSFPQYDKGSSTDYESTLEPVPQHVDEPPFVTPPVPVRHLGDVVVCFPVAIDQAMKRGKMVDDHIYSLIEHGILHLLGHHHE